jgi:protein TonB
VARRRSATFFIYAGSIAFHAAMAIGAVAIPKPKRTEAVAITLTETKKAPPPPKEEEAPKAPPPPPPPPEKAPSKAKAAPSPAADPVRAAEAPPPSDSAPSASGDGFADLGFAMSNGTGGFAVAAGPRGAATAALAPSTTTRKVSTLRPKVTDACDEAPIKPKPRTIVKPVYSDAAKSAQVEGVVRIEITIDEEGRVVKARVLRGLGYGLDDAALAAARQMTFEAGTRCGKPALATLSLGMRFALGS